MPPTRTSSRQAGPEKQLTLDGQLALTGVPKKSKQKLSETARVYTDVVLTIKPEFVKRIVAREKNHEYRNYKLRDTVQRLWLYETSPTSAITHVINVGAPRVPGEVKDPSGFGNDDFDAGRKQSKYGYPIHGMYRLQHPLHASMMKAKYSMAPPQGYMYAPAPLIEGEPLDTMDVLF